MNWFTVGIIASLMYGICAVSFKFVLEEKYLHGSPQWMMLGMGIGWFLCGWVGTRLWPVNAGEATTRALAWGIPIGIFNGVATLLILRALQSPTTNVSQLVPLYNTNTLVASVLAIVIFRELPVGPDLYRTLGGALLIVFGSALIGMKQQ